MAVPKGKKSATKKKAPANPTFGPRTSPVRWFRGIGLLVLGMLVFVSLADYDPKQPGLVPAFANTTAGGIEPNLVGYLGRDFAYLLNHLLGFGSWALSIGVVWTGILYLTRRAHRVRWFKLLSILLLTASFAGLATSLAMAGWFDPAAVFPASYYTLGPGGGLGYYLYEQALHPHLGPFGGNALLVLMLGIGSFGLFGGSARQVGAWIGGRFEGWSERRAAGATERAEARRLRSEERRARKAEEREVAAARKAAAKVEPEAPVPEPTPPAPEPVPVVTGEERGLLKVPVVPPRNGNSASRRVKVLPDPEPEPVVPKVTAKPTPPVKVPRAPETPAVEPSATANAPLKIVAGERVEKADVTPKKRVGTYRFPPLSLLADVPATALDPIDDHTEVAHALQRTLDEFGIKASLGEIHTGPVITRYEVVPAPGVRVEKIANLEKNIGMALRAQSVRILAPVPGKGVVGIEIPNRTPSPVCLREIVESRSWVSSKAEIPIVLGKDVSGKPLVTDLTRMPHLLIAGSTGSGKTVCINAIIASLLYHSSPAELRFLMVDPKIVEMQVFNSLPHMLIPVVTDPKRVPAALKWLIGEMERRYQTFARIGVRNIAGFNAKVAKDREDRQRSLELDAAMSPEERAALSQAEVPRDGGVESEEMPREKLPYIVCIVDELADLMMVAPADIETCIARLAQLARAAGIHLILATQRPSVNVITGVIKANLPSRIAFKVASKIDSRTILDAGGADALIGRGDMLFTPPGAHTLVRAQGAFVSDEEINALVEFLKVNGPPQILETVQQQIESGDEGDGSGGVDGDFDDDMVPRAIEVIRSSRRASTSMLQRRLKIGYNRAARIMEILEDEGYVGPDNGSQPREILMDLE